VSISLEPELAEEVREAASTAGESLSGWLAAAARARLRREALESFLDDWESRSGALTVEELAQAEKELGLRSSAAS